MPYIATLIAGLFGGLFSFFSQYLTKRFALVAVVLTVIAGFVSAFFVAIVGLIGVLQTSVPPEISAAASLVVPDNVPLLVSTALSARVLRWAYEWNVKVIQWRLF